MSGKHVKQSEESIRLLGSSVKSHKVVHVQGEAVGFLDQRTVQWLSGSSWLQLWITFGWIMHVPPPINILGSVLEIGPLIGYILGKLGPCHGQHLYLRWVQIAEDHHLPLVTPNHLEPINLVTEIHGMFVTHTRRAVVPEVVDGYSLSVVFENVLVVAEVDGIDPLKDRRLGRVRDEVLELPLEWVADLLVMLGEDCGLEIGVPGELFSDSLSLFDKGFGWILVDSQEPTNYGSDILETQVISIDLLLQLCGIHFDQFLQLVEGLLSITQNSIHLSVVIQQKCLALG